MTYDATALKQRIKLLEIELDRLKTCLEQSDLPDEPIFDGTGPRFITFRKYFGKGKAYTYAAVAPMANRWFITGRRTADWTDQGMTWAKLQEFMVKEEYEYTRRQVVESYRELS